MPPTMRKLIQRPWRPSVNLWGELWPGRTCPRLAPQLFQNRLVHHFPSFSAQSRTYPWQPMASAHFILWKFMMCQKCLDVPVQSFSCLLCVCVGAVTPSFSPKRITRFISVSHSKRLSRRSKLHGSTEIVALRLHTFSFAHRHFCWCLLKKEKKHKDDKTWLVVGPPLWKIWKSIGMISNPIYGKIKHGNQTTNQKQMHFMLEKTCFKASPTWHDRPSYLRKASWRFYILHHGAEHAALQKRHPSRQDFQTATITDHWKACRHLVKTSCRVHTSRQPQHDTTHLAKSGQKLQVIKAHPKLRTFGNLRDTLTYIMIFTNAEAATYKGLLEKMDALLDHTPNLIIY